MVLLMYSVDGFAQQTPDLQLSFDLRNSVFFGAGVNIGFGNGSNAYGYNHQTAIFGTYNISYNTVGIEMEYKYKSKISLLPSVGVNLNTTVKDGAANFGIKPMIGYDLFVSAIYFGYNFNLANNISEISSSFSFVLQIRLIGLLKKR
jgi:hypothetical protein